MGPKFRIQAEIGKGFGLIIPFFFDVITLVKLDIGKIFIYRALSAFGIDGFVTADQVLGNGPGEKILFPNPVNAVKGWEFILADIGYKILFQPGNDLMFDFFCELILGAEYLKHFGGQIRTDIIHFPGSEIISTAV